MDFPYSHDPVPYAWYERVHAENNPLSVTRPVELGAYLYKAHVHVRRSSAQVEAHFAGAAAAGPRALDLGRYYAGTAAAPLKLGAVGDLMWLPAGTGDFLRDSLWTTLRRHDLVFGNLETPVVPDEPVSAFHGGTLRFNAEPAFLDALVPVFGVLQVINNHSLDRAEAGLRATIAQVQARGMVPVGVARGLRADEMRGRYEVVERNGIKLGFVAVTWGLNFDAPPAYATVVPNADLAGLPDLAEVARLVSAARRDGAEVVVLGIHQGHEYEYFPHPLQMAEARELAKLGVDVIVGSHPHVLQPIEVLQVNVPEARGTAAFVEDTRDPRPRCTLVAYSLGNFTADVLSFDPAQVGGLLSVELRRVVGRADGKPRVLVTDAHLTPLDAKPGGVEVSRRTDLGRFGAWL